MPTKPSDSAKASSDSLKKSAVSNSRLGLRATARQLGISHAGLNKAVNEGRVTKGDDGKFDVEEARNQLTENSHPKKRHPKKAPAKSEDSEHLPTVASSPLLPSKDPNQGNDAESGSILEAARQLEWERLEKVRIDNALRRRELAPVAEVNAFVAGMIIRARDKLTRVGPELRDRLAQTADPVVCEELVQAVIDKILSELAEFPTSPTGVGS